MMIIQPSRFTPAGGGGPSGVVLLIGAEGSDGSTTIIDESPIARTLTANGACAIETTGALVGTSSLAINQANESTGYLNCGASSDFQFGTGDFTIEGRAKSNFNDGSFGHFLIGNLTYGNDNTWGLAIKNSPNNYLEFSVGNSGTGLTEITATTGDVDTTAFHFAVSRNGSTIRLFKDGVMVKKDTGFSMNCSGTGAVYVGWNGAAANGEKWRGLIDELRVVKGTGLYNSDSSFTPSTPYPR
jgi:hypothetical protein